jgi:hypothetical protein
MKQSLIIVLIGEAQCERRGEERKRKECGTKEMNEIEYITNITGEGK